MKKAFLLTTFSILTPLVLVLALSLLSYSFKNNQIAAFSNPRVAYAALPEASGTLKTGIVEKDARITAVKEFFKRYNSDLLPFAENVVAAADKYDLDYRLIPAIGMQESNLCKKAPKDSYNCWGFGIYGKKITRFDGYEDAINTVTKALANNYKLQGLVTPEEIMTKYTPGSNGSWAESVNHFMAQL